MCHIVKLESKLYQIWEDKIYQRAKIKFELKYIIKFHTQVAEKHQTEFILHLIVFHYQLVHQLSLFSNLPRKNDFTIWHAKSLKAVLDIFLSKLFSRYIHFFFFLNEDGIIE